MIERKTVLLLSAAGLGFRILHYLIFSKLIVAGSDQMQNILLARQFASGNFYGVLDAYWTPFYPVLIGFTTYFYNDLIISAAIVSIISGSLAVPLTYLIVRQSYGRREAVIAAILAVFYPFLINSVFALGTENVYLPLILGALILGWRGLQQKSALLYFSTGILLGLAYLTRPEAFGYPLFFIAAVLVKNISQGTILTRDSAKQTVVLLLGFMICAAPYIFYLHSATGEWTISGKASVNISAGAMRAGDYTTAAVSVKQSAKVLIINFVLCLREVQKSLANLLPFLMIFLVALGLFAKRWDEKRFGREIYLILFCVLTIIGYSAAVVQDRYFYFLLPIFFGWMARGIVQTERWLHDTLQNLLPENFPYPFSPKIFYAVCLALIYFYVFSINFYVRSAESAWQGAAFEERDAGLWLKDHSKPSPEIYSAGFRPVFYAEGKQFWTTATSETEITSELKKRGTDFVIVNERAYKENPHLENFSQYLQNSREFELIYQRCDQPDYKISIYKLK